MNKTLAICTGTAVVAVLAFMQAEIASVHDDVQEIKQFIIHTNDRVAYTPQDSNCLAKNIYHEAGVEDIRGKFAVAQVTLNRLKTGRWGKNICSVVYAKSQFSWTLYTKKRNEQPRGPLWAESQRVATQVLAHGARVPSLQASHHYHAVYIKKPVWTRAVAKIQQIGQHVFYS